MSDKTSNKELQKVTRRLLHIDKRINSGKRCNNYISMYIQHQTMQIYKANALRFKRRDKL